MPYIKKRKNKEIFVILHNIRSLQNIGSIFRTSDCAGVSKIYLSGYTASPLDELGNIRREIYKTALSAEKNIAWEKILNISRLIDKLKKEDINIIALEQSKKSKDYRKIKPKFPIALIMGNEVRGISKNILNKVDSIVEIPLKGKKESLNVSVSFGIAIFKLLE